VPSGRIGTDGRYGGGPAIYLALARRRFTFFVRRHHSRVDGGIVYANPGLEVRRVRFDGEIAYREKGAGSDGALPRPALRGERQAKLTSRSSHTRKSARLVCRCRPWAARSMGRKPPGPRSPPPHPGVISEAIEIAVVQGRQPPALSLAPGRVVDQYAIRPVGVDILEPSPIWAMETRHSAAVSLKS